MASLSGAEIARRTLDLESVREPCILASWTMKREFFRKMAGREDIYRDAPRIVVDAFVRAGANLCPQFIMSSPAVEHRAADPFEVMVGTGDSGPLEAAYGSPENVRDSIERLPATERLAEGFDVERAADEYAFPLLRLAKMAEGRMLFLGDFGQADFMGGYTTFGYENYMAALALYPEHLRRYFAYTGEQARLMNLGIARAVKKHGLAPFVYGGQDICYNAGPICSPAVLDDLYFPPLVRAVEPLHAAGIGIVWHCDGDVRPILDRLINDVGVAGFQGFQEETGCTLDGVAARRTRKGGKLVIWGSVSVTSVLPYGTVEDVKRDVERCFRVAAPGGGFGLASTSSILPEVPIANILAIYEHGLKFGREFLSAGAW